MLGRTDSRRRLSFLLLVFVVGRGRRCVARLALLAGRRARPPGRRGARADDDHGSRPRASAATSTTGPGTVVLATTVERERLVADADRARRRTARGDGRRARPTILGLDDDAATATCATSSRRGKYVILAHGLDATVADQIRAAIADQDARRACRSSRSRCASTRRPAAARTRPSRRSSSASSTATAPASTASSSTTRPRSPAQPRIVVAERDASGQADRSTTRRVVQAGRARRGPPPDHRRRPPAARSSRSSWPPGSPTGRSASRPS